MERIVKLAILACVLIVLAFGAAAIYLKQNYSASFSKETNNNLTAEQRQDYDSQLRELSVKLDAAKVNDEKYTLYTRQGDVLHALGRLSDAKSSYEKAIDLKPDEYIARLGLYQTQLDMNDKKGALKTIKAINIKHPELTEAWFNYIALEKELNPDKDNINDAYVNALAKTGNHILIMKEYAKWLEESGNLATAREYWQEILERDPGHKAEYNAEIKRLDTLLNK